MDGEQDLRQRLRRLPALAGDLPGFDPGVVPDEPTALFLSWFEEALAADVPEPHAVTVATADPSGVPSARVVVLKDVGEGVWSFATDRRSEKARDLDANPQVALSFYWQRQGRQVRIAGTAAASAPEESAADFLSRSPSSRAAAFATRPGDGLASPDQLAQAMEEARERVDAGPGLVLPEWVVYEVTAREVEFWQGRRDRAHIRLRYERGPHDWDHRLLWP
jgi:pyridoxamine 5'-phosphate oxidase